MATNNRIKFGVDYQVNKSSIQQVKKSLQDLQNIKIADFSGSEQQLQNVQRTAKQVEQALTKAFNPTLNTVNIDKFNEQLAGTGKTLDSVYRDFSQFGSQGRQAFTQVTSQIMTTNTQLRETKTLLTSMGQTMMNTVKWGIASSVMNSFTGSVQQAFSYVKSLDSALNDIRIVTGDSTQKMAQFAEQANKSAQALGRSTMDYSKAALTFYQQGLGDADVQARTEATLKAQNITGAGQEMADYLTAVWNGYKVANEEAELYVDKLAKVADSSASDMSQLAVAMSKVASTANMLGVPIDSLNAQIATIVATTRQAPESVGNALKTIYARINDIATGSEDAQISLGNYSSKMAEVGISVLDASGHLRDTGDVIEEVGQKWNTLSREQQIYLARTMAGQRQYNNLLALFENWGRYSDLVTVSMQSQGATMEKNAIYLDSLEAKMEQFGAAGERVKAALIDEEDLKGITQFGTNTVNLIGSLIEGLGGGKNALLALGSVFTSLFSNVIGKQIGNIIVKSQQAKASMQAMAEAIANTQTMRASTAYQDNDVYKKYVNDLREVQKTWTVLSVEEKKAQEQRALDIAQWSQQKKEIQENQQAAQKLAQTFNQKATIENNFSGAQTALKNLNRDLIQGQQYWDAYWKDAGDELDYQVVLTNIESIQTKLNKDVSELPFFNSLKQAANDVNNTTIDFDTLNNEIEQFYAKTSKTTNLALNITQSKNELSDFNTKLKQTQDQFQQVNNSASTVFNTQQVVKFAASIGQVASIISTTSNLFKTWQNDSISLGQKLTQTFTTIGFMIPMIVNSIKGISESLGISTNHQLKLNLLQQQETLQKKLTADQTTRQRLEEERITLLQKQRQINPMTGNYSQQFDQINKKLEENKKKQEAVNKAIKEGTQGIKRTGEEAGKVPGIFGSIKNSVTSAFKSIGNFITAHPWLVLGAAIGTVAIAIGKTLYDAWNKAAKAAQEAEKKANLAKQTYKDLKTSFDDLKSSIQDYQSLQDNMKQLVKGTDEWNKALQTTNDKIFELIDKFPELINYVHTTADGLMEISEEDLNKALSNRRTQTQIASLASTDLQIQSNQATRTSNITNLARNLGFSDGFGINESFEKLIQAAEETNGTILEDKDAIQELTGFTDSQIQKIQDHQKEIRNLIEETQKNTSATEKLKDAYLNNIIIDDEKYQGVQDKEFLRKILSSEYNTALKQQQENNLRTTRQEGFYADSFDAAADLTDVANNINSIIAEYKLLTNQQVRVKDGILEVFDTVTEQWKESSVEYLQAKIDETNALKVVDDASENVIQTLNHYKDSFGDFASAIFDASQGKKLDFSGFSLDEVNKIFFDNDFIQNFADQFGISFTQAKAKIDQGKRQLENNINQFVENIPSYFQEGFKEAQLDTKLSGQAQQTVLKFLQQAWNEGVYHQIIDAISQMDSSQIIPYLQEYFAEATGQALQEATPATDKYATIYDTFTGFFEKLAKDAQATLSNTEYKNLTEKMGYDLSNFFTQTATGAWKLSKDADELFEHINNLSLQPFETELDNLLSRKENLIKVQNYQDTVSNKLPQIQRYSSVSEIGAATNFLSAMGINDNSLQAIQEARLAEDYEKVAELAPIINDYLSQYKTQWENISEQTKETDANIELLNNQQKEVTENAEKMKLAYLGISDDTSLTELINYYNERKIAIQEYQNVRETALQNELDDLNTTREVYEATYESLRDSLEQTSESFQNLSEAEQNIELDQLTIRCYELGQALDDLVGISDETFESLGEAIVAGQTHTLEFIQAVEPLRAALSEIFGTDIDTTFIEQHFNLIQQLANGNIQALGELQQILAQQYIAEIKAEADNESVVNAIIELENLINGINFNDIEIGATLDDVGFTNALIAMAEAAGMTAQEINTLLSQIGFEPEVTSQEIPMSQVQQTDQQGVYVYHYQDPLTGEIQDIDVSTYVKNAEAGATSITVPIINGKKIKYTGGSNLANRVRPNYQQKAAPTVKTPSGGGNKGSTSSPKKASIAKVSTTKIDTKQKETDYNPYQQVQKQYERQSDLLDDIQDQQKKLVNKDRLNNLKQQNEELEKQNDIIEKRQRISNDQNIENTTAWYRKQLQNNFDNISFDADGQIGDKNSLQKQATDAYNKAAQNAEQAYKKAQSAYNTWITDVWNTMTGDQQQANKALKEDQDAILKQAEENAKEAIKVAEQEYKIKTDLIKNYQKALEEDQKYQKEYADNIEKIYENRITASKIQVEIDVDTGNLEREWLDFENKVIKKIKPDDFLGLANASVKEIGSYFDSKQIQDRYKEIARVQNSINNIRNGGTDYTYGEDLAAAQERLSQLLKDQQDDLKKIQDLVDDIKDNYLDAIDKAKDKMDENVDQYERINDLIDHNVKLTELMFGDKAYDTMNKYYDLQKRNNQNELNSLVQQREYWLSKMNQQVVGSDAWKKFRENVDNTIDNINSKMQDMIDNLTKQWDNKVDGIINKLNNALTGNRGTDYLDEQWDYIDNFDNHFLDTVESRMGIQQVTDLYQKAIDDAAGNPASQQKINKLMNDQLKILREKDKLTEYDIERAKASLEVEKARMALEDARANKTKMRLRRDSQGNYTYQYVADEEKLSDLQSALADAQANLYNTDKEHYKQNLNDLYDTYKEYLEKRRALEEEMNLAQDEAEKERIQERINLLNSSFKQLYDGLSEDNEYLLNTYLASSFADALDLDRNQYSSDEFLTIMKENIPYVQSNIQDLVNTIDGEGGLINATAAAVKDMVQASSNYLKERNGILESVGTSVDDISNVVDANGQILDKTITQAESLIANNKVLIDVCDEEITKIAELMQNLDKLLDSTSRLGSSTISDMQEIINQLAQAYNIGQQLNVDGSTVSQNTTAPQVSTNQKITDQELLTVNTSDLQFTGNAESDASIMQKAIEELLDEYKNYLANMSMASFDTGGGTGSWGDTGKVAILHQKQLVLNPEDTLNLLTAIEIVRGITNSMNGFVTDQLGALSTDAQVFADSLKDQTNTLDQNVHIEANFPNVTQHTEIEQAFNNLINIASMRASGGRN